MQPDPWQAQFDQQLASASKTVLISAVGIGALLGLGLGVPGIVIGGIVLVCGLGAVLLARSGKA